MSAKALKLHLPHFGTPRPRPSDLAEVRKAPAPDAPAEFGTVHDKPAAAKAAHPAHPARPVKEAAPDPAIVLAAAVDAARAETLATARQQFEAERARDAEAFEQHLALVRQQWEAEVSGRFADSLKVAHEEMEARISAVAGRVLLPFLTEAVRVRALSELSAQITRLMSDPRAPALRICGPESILDALRCRLGTDGIDYQTNDDVDVRVTADDTIIETQLRAWSTHLTAALA